MSDMYSEVDEDGVVNFYVTPQNLPALPMEDITLRGGRRDGLNMKASCDTIEIIGDIIEGGLLAIDVYAWNGTEEEEGRRLFNHIYTDNRTIDEWTRGYA